MSYPAITTAAFFTAIVLYDVIQRRTEDIGKHVLLGFISTLIMVVLSQKGADFVAWGLLTLPMFIIALSFIVIYLKGPSTSPASIPAATATAMAKAATAVAAPMAQLGLPASAGVAASCAAPIPVTICPSEGATSPTTSSESQPAPAPPKACIPKDIGLSPSVKC